MDADGVEVLHRADGEHVARTVAQHFELYLLPAADVFFYEHLCDGREHQAVVSDYLKLFLVVGDAAARTAKGVRGADYYGIAAYPLRNLKALFHRICDIRRNDGLVYLLHRLFEEFPVLRPVYRAQVYAYELYAPLVQKSLFGELASEREPRLAAERGEQAVRTLLYYDPF